MDQEVPFGHTGEVTSLNEKRAKAGEFPMRAAEGNRSKTGEEQKKKIGMRPPSSK